jgi:hypothetical protein
MKVLARRPLQPVPLIVADAAVVKAAVAGHILVCARARHVTGALADDDRKLAFEVVLLGGAGPDHRLGMTHEAVGEAHENHRILGTLAPHLFDVRQVVHADAQKLSGGVVDQRAMTDIVEREIGGSRPEIA